MRDGAVVWMLFGLTSAYLEWWGMELTRYFGMVWVGSVLCAVWRLFELAENKSITMAKLFSLGVERGDAWRWRRRLWAWE